MTIETLADLISQVESNGNPQAVRFEPQHAPRAEFVAGMMELVKCNYNTARNFCSISWGRFQIMGDELIALGLKVSPLVYVNDEIMQLDFFNRYGAADHLSMTLADVLTDSSKRRIFARLYNGPGNVDGYMQRMVDVATANGLQVTA